MSTLRLAVAARTPTPTGPAGAASAAIAATISTRATHRPFLLIALLAPSPRHPRDGYRIADPPRELISRATPRRLPRTPRGRPGTRRGRAADHSTECLE